MYHFPSNSTANHSVLKIIVSVLFIALPFLGFYLGVQYQNSVTEPAVEVSVIMPTPHLSNQPYPSVSINQNEMVNWKTYRDTINNYSIKYPANWFNIIKPYADNEPLFSNKNSFKPVNTSDEIRMSISVYNKDSSQCTAGSEHDCTWYFNNDFKMVPNEVRNAEKASGVTKISNLIIDGQPAVLTKNQIGNTAYNLMYTTKIGDNFYYFNFNTNNQSAQDQNRQLFNQILSTFKFMGQEAPTP